MACRSFRSLVSLSALCAAAFAWECVAPQSAQAACGDYVHMGRSHSAEGDAGQGMPFASSTESGLAEGRPGPRKCHGPGCRNEQPPPSAPAPVPPTPTVEDWARLIDGVADFESDSHVGLVESGPVFAIGNGERIDRPPRAGSRRAA